MSTCVKIINLIRARALNHRLFKRLCQEMGFELREEVLLFLKNKANSLYEYLERENFVEGLAYLVYSLI